MLSRGGKFRKKGKSTDIHTHTQSSFVNLISNFLDDDSEELSVPTRFAHRRKRENLLIC